MFAFKLASHLKMTVEELLARMSSREFSEWFAFYRLEPFGCSVEDNRFGIVASLIYNTNRAPNSKALAPHEFFQRDPVAAAEVEKRNLAQTIKAAFAGLKRKPKGPPINTG